MNEVTNAAGTPSRPGALPGHARRVALLLAFIASPLTAVACSAAEPASGEEQVPQAAGTEPLVAEQDAEAADSAHYANAEAAFASYDINQDEYLTGTELTACDCIRYDISGGEEGGDGVVERVEFMTMNYLERKGMVLPEHTPGPGVAAATPAAAPATPPPAAPPAAPRQEPRPVPPQTPVAPSRARPAPEAPFSRAEILALIRSEPGAFDTSVPYEDVKAASDRLVRLIETRGVDFHYDFGTFDKEMYETGASSQVKLAISRNYRAPGSAPPAHVMAGSEALVGAYDMGIAGSTTRYDRQGSAVVRTDRDVGFAGGGLIIGADGRYEWRLLSGDDPSTTFRGTWREASQAEAGTEVGPAIVLPSSYEGADWIVTLWGEGEDGSIRVTRLDQKFRFYIGSPRR